MSSPIITVENLGKRYRIRHQQAERYTALRDVIAQKARGLWTGGWRRGTGGSGREAVGGIDHRILPPDPRPPTTEDFWALRNVSFEVKEGEVIGIIGRNGAGKSTLLKILSRITEPTEGRVRLRGRVASLLEVGTGFHPELTGRENIFLNGAILGMAREEIKRKFDEIVAFAEVEKFLDTPVKRYSSGMYVRLAFAVAAHMEPEILVVDEVLAVGDAEFQKKCLGKIQNVATDGRTVLFVSHNMQTVASLCHKVIIMEGGRNGAPMPATNGVQTYLASSVRKDSNALENIPRYQAIARKPVFTSLDIRGDTTNSVIVPTCSGVRFQIGLRHIEDVGMCECGIVICDEFGHRVAAFQSFYNSGMTIKGGRDRTVSCHVPSLPLVPAVYSIELVIASGYQVIEKIERAGQFEVVFADVFGSGRIPGPHQGRIVLPAQWTEGT